MKLNSISALGVAGAGHLCRAAQGTQRALLWCQKQQQLLGKENGPSPGAPIALSEEGAVLLLKAQFWLCLSILPRYLSFFESTGQTLATGSDAGGARP